MADDEIKICSGDPAALGIHLAQVVGALSTAVLRMDPGAPERATIVEGLRYLRNHAEALGRSDVLPELDRNWANAQK
jgi:hypothetical protein